MKEQDREDMEEQVTRTKSEQERMEEEDQCRVRVNPAPAGRKTGWARPAIQFKGGGPKQKTSIEKIMGGVRRANLHFKLDSPTLRAGNCFPSAVTQQCRRQEVEIHSIVDHQDLRKKVTNYMLTSQDRVVVDMRRRWAELVPNESWVSYWNNMGIDGVWVDEVFIWATAWYLNRDIFIIWDTATPDNPYTFFSGDREGDAERASPGAPLIIGHDTDFHYQSLLPDGDDGNPIKKKSFAKDLTTTLERVLRVLMEQNKKKEPQQPATTEPATTEPATSEPATTKEPVTTKEPATTEPVTTKEPATTEPATTEPATTTVQEQR